MTRFASALLLLVGAVILLAIQVSPATSAPGIAIPAASPLDEMTPMLVTVDAQVDRMRERLATVPKYPPPGRDPFSFGAPRPAPAPRPAVAVPPPPAYEAPPVLPRLVAVLSTAADGGMLRTAVFAAGDDVQIVSPGSRVGNFVVRSIAFDTVTLVDPTTGAAFRVR